MKKLFFTLAVASLMAGTTFTGCKSPGEKEAEAKENVQDAKEDLKEVRNDANEDAQKLASAEEWKTFRIENEEKISKNETRIAELKEKLMKPGKILDPVYEKRIDMLEARNKELEEKMDAYEKSQSNWESFKSEFKHDMDELGQSLKDFTVDNKK